MKIIKTGNRNELPELPIPKGAVTWLAVSMAVAVGWHVQHVPLWSWFASLLIGLYAYLNIIKNKPMPPKWLRLFLTVAAVAGIFLTFRAYLGRDPGITALLLLSVLKLMELKHRKDFMFLVFLCYFMVFGNFLYDQSIEDLAFTLLTAVLITATILRLNQPENIKAKAGSLFRHSLKLILFAVPFTTMLFFLFPRSTGPLWNLSQESVKRFQTGFNDSVEPGQIANLAQSKLPAFKVEFPDDNMPEMKDLYFRGLVLWFTDGKKWVQGILPSTYIRTRSYNGPGILHRITLQPHNERWLFGLDRPEIFPDYSRVLPGNVFQTSRPIKAHYRYTVRSQLNTPDPDPPPEKHLRWALQLPNNKNQRLIKLGRQWREQASSDEDVVVQAQAFFKNSGFVYTLNPGLLDEDEPMEDFLFTQRRGFCEHYSSAFAMLMRAANIPARLVVGFQGGEYNSIGKFLLVRHSDAHAWVEIQLEGRGWVRIDPTAWVAPERIQYGLDVSQTLASMGNLSEDDRSVAIEDALKQGIVNKIFKFFKEHWDNINYKWDVWIISYDRFKQRDILRSLGLQEIDSAGLMIAVIIIVPLFFLSISYLLKRQTLSRDPLLRLYQKFCRKMEKAGLQRLRWEGPFHFRDRACNKFPDQAPLIHKIASLFVTLRYDRLPPTKAQLKDLKQHISKIN